ncbi:uncharacterized protein N7529_001250 [Penicillium soppii]|jgi:glutamate/tyrosine decarboxylase-like PLP-dependent enzyme|uniref:uncharacterized protein n=1 Tax=Penicillium soppii TaxID=69789 RepID=UPI002548DED4|nr:uncharacterized protein N7529_001250 [Penicillium soppii]KAJ5882578.1 hypothetical protein N7529_001250 [Penicillium soppii]
MSSTTPTHKTITPLQDIESEIDDQWGSILNLFDDLRNVIQPSPDEKLVQTTTDDDIKKLRALAAPSSALPLMGVVKEAYKIFDFRMRTNHPMFFGFVPSNATSLAWLGDVLVSAFNTHVGGHIAGSGPSTVETELIEWLASRIYFPPSSGGIFVSGGSVANLMAIIVASDQILQQTDRSGGVIYISDQAHYSLAKMARILGFSEKNVRRIASDSRFRMQSQDLEHQIKQDRERGLKPFLIIGSYGCTETGAIDPIKELADIARGQDMWLHVDGAFGASATLSYSRPQLAKELSHAHSVSWDAHKWLFQTYGCGMLLVHDKAKLASTFRVKSDFIDHSGRVNGNAAEFWDLGIELTRPSRAMSLWFTLRVLGIERIGKMIDIGIDFTETMQHALEQLSDWEIVAPATLAILNFRYNPGNKTNEDLNNINARISEALADYNDAAIFTVQLRGKTALRMCCINTKLVDEDIANLVTFLNQTVAGLDAHCGTHD